MSKPIKICNMDRFKSMPIVMLFQTCNPLKWYLFFSSGGEGGGSGEVGSVGTEVTLLSQLSAMPSMSPLISSPVPSVGSVVPNISLPTSQGSIIFTSNGITSDTPPEV